MQVIDLHLVQRRYFQAGTTSSTLVLDILYFVPVLIASFQAHKPSARSPPTCTWLEMDFPLSERDGHTDPSLGGVSMQMMTERGFVPSYFSEDY